MLLCQRNVGEYGICMNTTVCVLVSPRCFCPKSCRWRCSRAYWTLQGPLNATSRARIHSGTQSVSQLARQLASPVPTAFQLVFGLLCHSPANHSPKKVSYLGNFRHTPCALLLIVFSSLSIFDASLRRVEWQQPHQDRAEADGHWLDYVGFTVATASVLVISCNERGKSLDLM